VARVYFDKGFKIRPGFDLRDAGWWDADEVRADGGGSYGKATLDVSFGRVVLIGDFHQDSEGHHGRIGTVVFKDDDGSVVATIRGVGRDISQIHQTIEDGPVTRVDAARMFDHVVQRVSQVKLSDRGDRPDSDWFAPLDGMDVRGRAGSDTILGSMGDDRLYGNAGGDTLSGARGDDYVAGGNGADDLSGGAGRDRLVGGASRDVLSGGGDKDVLIGGAGSDTFHFDKGDGRDRITDFRDKKDMIWIGKGADGFEDLTIRERGDDTVVRFADVAFTVEDTAPRHLTEADFLF
jgi:hypothetical protein